MQVDATKVMCNIENADNVNHVVVFMTGTSPFPDGYGGAVYFSWPTEGSPAWHLLGFLANDKPSAIFKVSSLKRGMFINFWTAYCGCKSLRTAMFVIL